MSLIEDINPDDIRKVISYSQSIKEPKIDVLLNTWARAKSILSSKFLHGQTTFTVPEKVQFCLSEDEQLERFDNFIDYIKQLFDNWSHPLACFLEKLTLKEFYENSIDHDYIIDPKEGKKIQKGTKVVKSFKYFIDNDKVLEALQNKASEIIQENKVEGYLTFSIHPLDFLSLSENNNGWRSCHALDGEYRAGNLSYICDSSTMVVYLHNDKMEKLPRFPNDVPWNNKKWRMLMHFNTGYEACFAGRQYPFFSAGALTQIFKAFTEYMTPKTISFSNFLWECGEEWAEWSNDYLKEVKRNDGSKVEVQEDTYCIFGNGIYDRFKIVKDEKNSKHYNDVTRSSCYLRPYYMYKENLYRNNLKFRIGAAVPCLRCGENLIEDSESMVCSNCEAELEKENTRCTCEQCGATIPFEETFFLPSGEPLCSNCYRKSTFICENCGLIHFNDEKVWDEESERFICQNCYYINRSEN